MKDRELKLKPVGSIILLTGATGFTGQYLLKAAEGSGFVVRALKADVTDREAVAAEVRDASPDIVVHLAGVTNVTHNDEVDFYKVNTIGTTNVLSALAGLRSRPKRVILASSANVYGNSSESPIGENARLSPSNHYAVSKVAMEIMAKTYSDYLPIIITRPFNYIGVGQNEHFVVAKMVGEYMRRSAALELGNLDVEREFNDVRDVLAAYLAIAAIGRPGEVYNICSGRTYALRDVIALLSDITGHTPEIRIDERLVRRNEITRLCGNPEKLNHLMMSHVSPLDWRPLRETLQWMCSDLKGSDFVRDDHS